MRAQRRRLLRYRGASLNLPSARVASLRRMRSTASKRQLASTPGTSNGCGALRQIIRRARRRLLPARPGLCDPGFSGEV
ncbi:unnamed protein product [Symbiodinium microadriaticum]|nr:unnamed protein product [Symbiodinium microadriaticum]